jgi:hypothetical protein
MDDLFVEDGIVNRSEYLDSKFGTQATILENLTGGAIATVVDFGTSVYNSLPGTEEVSTADILSRVSSNALTVYEENQDTIEALSFIGGSFIPGTLALKGMGALRAGAKSVSWFSDLGKVENLAKVEAAFKLGAEGTKDYRIARSAIMRNGIANNLLDAAAMEMAVVGTMNAAPLLEDYWDDPAKNFAISMAFGGIIGGGAGIVADRFALNKLTGGISTKAFTDVTKNLADIPNALPSLGRLKVTEANIKSLENLIDPNYKADPLVKEYANSFLLQERTKQAALFNKMVSPEIEALDKPIKDAIMAKVLKDDRNAGGDSIKFLTINEDTLDSIPKQGFIGKLKDTFSPTEMKDPKTGKVIDIDDVVYLPEYDRYSSMDEATNYLRADVTGLTTEELTKLSKQPFGNAPNVDASLEIANKTTSHIDKQYLLALKQVDGLDARGLKKLVVAPDDLYMLNALSAKFKKDPAAFEGITIKVSKKVLNYDDFTSQTLKAAKVKPDHLEKLKSVGASTSKYNLMASRALSDDARAMLSDWVAGGHTAKQKLRSAMEKALRSSSQSPDAVIAREIFNSKESVAMRKYLTDEVADAEGNVYLYRGIEGKTVGHSPIESYSATTNVSQHFGRNNQLYKVHVDDIIGTVTKHLNEYEFLVGSAARPAVASIPVGSAADAAKLNPVKAIVKDWTATDIGTALTKAKESSISSMLGRGIPPETISIRTNTPLETVKGFATRLDNGEGFSDLMKMDNYAISSYSDADAIPSYLAPENRPLRIKSNVDKTPFAALYSNLDKNLGLNATLEYMDVVGQTTASNTFKNFHQMFFGDTLTTQGMKPAIGMVRAAIGEFNNSTLGYAFTQSSDFFLRNTGVGKIASLIGKNLQTVATKSAQALTTPLTEKMALVAKNPLALIEANTAMTINAGLSGSRIWRDGQFYQMVADDAGKMVEQAVLYQGRPFIVQSKETKDLFDALAVSGRELFELKNSINSVLGKGKLNDLGFWVPAFNPNGKFLSYVWDRSNNSTKLLWGNTERELVENTAAYKATIPPEKLSQITIATKQEQALWNDLNERLDPLTMQIANVEKFHTGASQTAIVRNNTDIFGEIIGGYENYIESHTKRLGELMMHDTMAMLDNMSTYNRRLFDEQPLGAVGKLVNNPEDGARAVKNILLGNSNLSANPLWKSWNDNFETYTNWGFSFINDTFKTAMSPFGKKEFTADSLKKLDYEKIATQLESNGMANPWKAFDDEAAKMFNVASLHEAKNTTKRAIYASNAFAATFALRVLDVAQPLVNAMSLPILTSLAKAQNHPEYFMSAKLKTANVSTSQIMFEGARLNNSLEGKRYADAWEKAGYFDSYVSEANSALRESRKFEAGSIAKIENALDSNLIRTLSKPADATESIIRRQTMFTGAVLAKRLYPDLDDAGVTIFARDFMDKAIGNYHAPQRPVFFQGTMGVGLGLFQTYMLTLGQSMYRHLEFKNYKALGKAALVQSGIFGGSSMPGFDLVSTAIGDHYSDENIDLTTGSFRALGDPMATALLYGLPSSLGPAFYTRGDLQPRAVSPLNGGQGFAAVNMIKQTIDFAGNLANSAASTDPTVARSIGQAISLQSVSRPLARAGELFTGYSVTGKGNTVSTPDDVWSFTGITSRLLSTRPTEEAKVREAIHLNTVYGQLDNANRQKTTKALKTAIREGTLDNAKLAELANEYMSKSGTPRGWQAAVNKAIAETNTTGKAQLIKHLRPDNSVMHMIDSMDGE